MQIKQRKNEKHISDRNTYDTHVLINDIGGSLDLQH
jgi:hypothetical protein